MAKFLVQNDAIGLGIDYFGRLYRYGEQPDEPLTLMRCLSMIPILLIGVALWLFFMAVLVTIIGLVIAGLGWLYFIKGVGILSLMWLTLVLAAALLIALVYLFFRT